MEHLPFTSTHPWNPERIGAMAIYCRDGRWGEAFDEFCHERLHIPRYDSFADCAEAVARLKKIMLTRAYESFPASLALVP